MTIATDLAKVPVLLFLQLLFPVHQVFLLQPPPLSSQPVSAAIVLKWDFLDRIL